MKHKHILLLIKVSYPVLSAQGQGQRLPCFQRLDQRLRHLTGEPLCRTRRSPVAVQINTNISINRQSKEAATSALPLALNDSRSVRAVKGSLRRFAPWTTPGRSEGMAVYEGKGGGRAVGCEGELAHDKGYYHSSCGGERAEMGTFRPYQTPEPQPWGAVTRRAVAKRRSRASGLTRSLAEAIRSF